MIGVDIGGTKTRAIAIDLSSKRIARGVAEGVNPAVVGRSKVESVLKDLLLSLLRELDAKPSNVTCVGIGSAGVGKGYWTEIFVSALSSIGIDSSRIRVYEDYRVAHTAAFLFGDGILVISGTGSSVYARCRDVEVKVGGWGHLLDDGGSAYQVGRDGMREALRFFDGRGEKTVLLEKMLRYLSIDDPSFVIPRVYGSENPKQVIAGFAPYVVESCREGDEVACRIIERSIDELAELIVAALRRTSYMCRDVAIVGGYWEGIEHIARDKLIDRVEKLCSVRINLVKPAIDSSCAAAVMAMKDLGILTAEAMKLVTDLCRR